MRRLFVFVCVCLVLIACGRHKSNSDAIVKKNKPIEEHPYFLQFAKDKPLAYRYEEDNTMEIVFWNNPIKPSLDENLITFLPERISIPENMVFVSGKAFESTGQRIRGFFIDRHPISTDGLKNYLSVNSERTIPAALIDYHSFFEKDSLHFLHWEMARAYCRNLGKRLPTKAEWTYAFSEEALIVPYFVSLKHHGTWEWLANWHLPEGQDPHIFVPDANSKKMIVRKQEKNKPIYEWKPIARKQSQLHITCRCVQDIEIMAKPTR